MKQIICDLCGKETNEHDFKFDTEDFLINVRAFSKIKKSNDFTEDRDLCRPCIKKIIAKG